MKTELMTYTSMFGDNCVYMELKTKHLSKALRKISDPGYAQSFHKKDMSNVVVLNLDLCSRMDLATRDKLQ